MHLSNAFDSIYIPYRWKIWRELNLADWPQPARIKMLPNFNLADGRILSSYAPNLLHGHARLRLLRGVACLEIIDCTERCIRTHHSIWTPIIGEILSYTKREIENEP